MTTTVSTSQSTCTCCKSRTPDLYGLCDKCINGTMGGLDTFTQLYTDLVAQCRSRDLSEHGTIEDMQARIEADEQEHQFCSMTRDEEDGTPTDIDRGTDSEPSLNTEDALRYAQVMAAGCQAGIGLAAATQLAESSIPTTTRINETPITTTQQEQAMNVTTITPEAAIEARQEAMSPTPSTTIPGHLVDHYRMQDACSYMRFAISIVRRTGGATVLVNDMERILGILVDRTKGMLKADDTAYINSSISDFQDHPWHSPRLNLRTVTDLHNAHVNAYLLWVNTYATAKEPIQLPQITAPIVKVEQSAIRQEAQVHTTARLTGTDASKARKVKGMKCHCGKPVWIGSHTNQCFQHTPAQVDKDGKSLIQPKAEVQVEAPVTAPVQQPEVKVDMAKLVTDYAAPTVTKKALGGFRPQLGVYHQLYREARDLGLVKHGETAGIKELEARLAAHKAQPVMADSTIKVTTDTTSKVDLESQALELYKTHSTSKLQALCSIKKVRFYPTEAKLILARRLVGINT